MLSNPVLPQMAAAAVPGSLFPGAPVAGQNSGLCCLRKFVWEHAYRDLWHVLREWSLLGSGVMNPE